MKEKISDIIKKLSFTYIGIIIIRIIVEIVKTPFDFLFIIETYFLKILLGFIYLGFSFIVDFFTRETDEIR